MQPTSDDEEPFHDRRGRPDPLRIAQVMIAEGVVYRGLCARC
jgi:hypothetical protein